MSETRVLPSRLEEQSKYLEFCEDKIQPASLPFPKKDIVTRQSASNWHQAEGETTLALCISLWHSDLPFQHVSSICSVSCNNFTVSPRLGDSRDGGEQYLLHCEELILCTCKIGHLGNIKLKKIGSNPKHQCENKKCNGDNHEWTKWNGRLVQPRQSIFRVMHSVLLSSTPSKPSTHHALISISFLYRYRDMYTINTTLHASNIDKESISGGVTELPHCFWEPAAVAVLNFKMENVYQNLSPKQ